jgi:hypothetical protein
MGQNRETIMMAAGTNVHVSTIITATEVILQFRAELSRQRLVLLKRRPLAISRIGVLRRRGRLERRLSERCERQMFCGLWRIYTFRMNIKVGVRGTATDPRRMPHSTVICGHIRLAYELIRNGTCIWVGGRKPTSGLTMILRKCKNVWRCVTRIAVF